MSNAQNMELFLKFLNLIPTDILEQSICNVSFNRENKRKFERFKNLNDKLKMIIKSSSNRCILISDIHNLYNSNFTLPQDLSYEDTLALFNKNNGINLTLHILKKCTDKDYDEQYFSDFMKSNQFYKTIKNEWGDSESSYNKIEPVININISKENNNMECYLGFIELNKTFYNFIPKFLLKNNKLIELSQSQMQEDFYVDGKICLSYKNRYAESYKFLEKLDINRNEDNNKGYKGIYIVIFDKNELLPNNNEFIQYKLDLEILLESGIDLRDRIKLPHHYGIYKVVTITNDKFDESFNSNISINEDFEPGEHVLLMNENEELFANLRSGYFQVQERSIDGLKYIQPNAGADKYIISHYKKDQYYGFILQKQPYMQEVHLVLLSSKSEVRDVISDDILISKLQENIDITLLHDNPEEFQRLYSNSPFLIDNPNDIREKRVQKIQSIINNALTYENEKKSAITSLIYKCNGEDIQKLLGDKIKESEEYKKVVENNDAFNRQTDEARAEVKLLEAKLEELKNQTHLQNNTANSVDDNELKDRRKEKNELDVKIEILKSEVLELEKQLYDLSVIKNLKDERMYLERRTDELGKEVDKLESKQKKLQSDVKEAITKGVNESAQNAFDPYISNALVEAAGQWRSQSELQDYEEIANFMEKYECDIIEKKDFLDIQVSGIQKFRSYTKNDILNMYICLSQNFLTIFSGEPGTGKTSICDILANSLGLNIFDNKKDERGKAISKNRYIPISVERGWSSKRDLIGYFNPLTKKYDRSNAKIYDGLMILNQEREKSRFPYIVLLDEANLSQVEYYWADFMRAADKTFNKYDETVMINIGLDEEIYIPKTLRFLATINNDHTTEELSPRLIDRAWIIKLPEVDPKEITDKISDCFKSPVIWDTIENTFIRSENMIVILKKPLNDIYALFDKFHLSVSPRVKQSIERYICVAQEIMEDELGVTKKEKALDYAVIQKLLPKINGLYSNYENLFKRLLEICTENHLKMTTEALTVMQEYSNQNMGYCKYLM